MANMTAGHRYRARIIDSDGAPVRMKNVDADGAFIFDGLKYGDYILEINDGDGRPVHRRRITIDRAFYTIDSPIDIKKS